jgi:hypothetical protein
MRKFLTWLPLLLVAVPAAADDFTAYVLRQPTMPAPFQATDYLPMVRNGIPYKVSLTSIESTLNIHLTGVSGSLGPSGCGTILDGWTFNCVWIDGDNVVPANLAKSNTTFYYTINGGTGSGNPFPLNAVAEVKAMPSTATVSTFFGATQFLGHGGVPSGGTIGANFFAAPTSIGNIYGNGVYAELAAGATGWRSNVGEEIDIKTGIGSSVEARIGLNIVSGPDNAAVQGSLIDAAIVIDKGGTVSQVGWQNAIQVGYFNNSGAGGAGAPVSPGGRILVAYTGTATALDTGIDISGLWNTGSGYTYTGDFFKASTSNHWTGAGAIVATTAGATNHDFVSGATDQLIAAFENVGGNATISVSSRAASKQASIGFNEAGTSKWTLGKQTDSSFFGFDVATTKSWITVGSGTPGQTVLGETGGSQLTLAPAGGATLTGMTTTGDGSGLGVCADSNGHLYRKAACP